MPDTHGFVFERVGGRYVPVLPRADRTPDGVRYFTAGQVAAAAGGTAERWARDWRAWYRTDPPPRYFKLVGAQPVPVESFDPDALDLAAVAARVGWSEASLVALHETFFDIGGDGEDTPTAADEPPSPSPSSPPPPPPPLRCGLELWPALLPEEYSYSTLPDADGLYTVTDERTFHDKPASGWVVRLTPNPLLDPASRDRVGALYGAGADLWRSLRNVLDLVPDGRRGEQAYVWAVRQLVEVGAFVPLADRNAVAEVVRRGVNEDTLVRLDKAAKEAAHAD